MLISVLRNLFKMFFVNRRRIFKFKVVVLSALVLFVLWLYVFFCHLFAITSIVHKTRRAVNRIVVDKHVVDETMLLPYVVVHLDFKGTPLKLSYLESLLPQLRKNGANSLLMEYEDMFPYEGKLVNLSAESSYRKSELKRFLKIAKQFDFKIIPLVRTFDHMEHALKLAEFQHLREDPKHPDSICPSKSESMALLNQMLEQVIHFHATVSPLKFIHIGCNEVFHLKTCDLCQRKNLSNTDIFLHHVKTLSAVVKSLYTNITLLIWDEMLRGIQPYKWKRIESFENVQIVYWDNNPKLKVTQRKLMRYQKKFGHLWIASAYKGADGHTAIFPELRKRFLNLRNWMNILQYNKLHRNRTMHNFQGIILTGLSRYTHMDPPCELLPVTYPTLMILLLLIRKFAVGFDKNFNNVNLNKVLSLNEFLDNYLPETGMVCTLETDVFYGPDCKFDGQNLYQALETYVNLQTELLMRVNKESELEFIEYYSNISSINTNVVATDIKMLEYKLKVLMDLCESMTKELDKYYEKDFAAEYVTYKTYYYKNKLQVALNSLRSYEKVRIWVRRSRNSTYFL